MEIFVKKYEDPFVLGGFSVEDILSVVQVAYKERLKDGIRFKTLDITPDDYRYELNQGNNVFFVAIENNKLYGIARLKNERELCNFAVLPEAQ